MWWDLRSPQSFLPEPIDFVGQQVGPVEDDLKSAFRQVLGTTPTAQSAYLARIYRGKAPQASVAVCVRSTTGMDLKLEERLLEIFRARFRGDQRLDILFVLEGEEARLREVCPPFYEKVPTVIPA